MDCSDLDLKVSGDDHHGYFVEVLSSPLACRSEPQELALPDRLVDRIKRLRERASDQQTNRRLGMELFSALFTGRIRDIWNQSIGMVRNAGTLRLRLDIRAPQMRSIPWEIIHDGKEYLALAARTPVIRYLHDNPSPPRPEHTGPLNLLLVAAIPEDLTPLPGVGRELETVRSIFAKLKAHGDVARLDVVERATSQQLHERFGKSYQVMHFMGHGAFVNNKGYLILEDEQHQSNWKEAETLSDLLRNNSLRLLVLNACDTAISSTDGPLIGVAQAAHAAGIPTVIAMQQTILDGAAVPFARAFYQALKELKPLETCLAVGRVAIRDNLGLNSAEWAIPVMFNNTFPEKLGTLWTAKNDPLAPGLIIDARCATGPIVLGNVGRDAIGTKVTNRRSGADEFDPDN